jgi:hypothetical protein
VINIARRQTAIKDMLFESILALDKVKINNAGIKI